MLRAGQEPAFPRGGAGGRMAGAGCRGPPHSSLTLGENGLGKELTECPQTGAVGFFFFYLHMRQEKENTPWSNCLERRVQRLRNCNNGFRKLKLLSIYLNTLNVTTLLEIPIKLLILSIQKSRMFILKRGSEREWEIPIASSSSGYSLWLKPTQYPEAKLSSCWVWKEITFHPQL